MIERLYVFALAALVLAGCTSSDRVEPAPSVVGAGAGGAGVGGAGGAGVGGAAVGGGAESIVLAATDGELDLPFTVGVVGTGTDRVGAVSLAGAVGTIELDGTAVSTAVYAQQSFFEYQLYQALAVAPDRWWLLWLYCENGELAYVYSEATDGTPLEYEIASGRCSESAMPSTAHVTFPAVDMPLPPLVPGYVIDGPALDYDGMDAGALTLGPTTIAFLPFGEVDCTEQCGAPGWRELHAVLWDPTAMRACAAILYLFDPGQPLLLTYALTLPDLSDPANGQTQFDATWSKR